MDQDGKLIQWVDLPAENDGPVPRDFFEVVLTAGRKFSLTDVYNGLTGPTCVGCNVEISLGESAVRCSNCLEWLHLRKCSGLRRLVDRVDTYIGACCHLSLPGLVGICTFA